jgi:hypothetical protein
MAHGNRNGYARSMPLVSQIICANLFEIDSRLFAAIKKRNNGLVGDRCWYKGNTLLMNAKSGSYEFWEICFDLFQDFLVKFCQIEGFYF